MKITILILLISSLASADFNILAVGDTGKGNEGQYAVGKAMAKECQSLQCRFSLLLGDNIYDTGLNSADDPQMIEKFEKPYAELNVPFYAALGNHDYGELANEWARGDYQLAYAKKNPKFILPSHYYSFEHDNALFLVLDTSRLFHDKDTQKQIQFIKDTLAKNTKHWVVVVAHHPYVSNGKHGNAGSYDGIPFPPYSGSIIKSLVENVLCTKIDLFISGHDHNLQTLKGTKACSKPLFVVSGSGASADAKLKEKNQVHFQKAVLGFTSLQFTNSSLTVNHINVDGKVEHSLTITK